MGRIKTKLTKRIGAKLVKKHEDKLSEKFDDNKKAVDELTDVPSKKMRNVIAGYASRLMKNKEEL